MAHVLQTASWLPAYKSAVSKHCHLITKRLFASDTFISILFVVAVLQVKTTSPDAYQVTPHRGVIDPGDVANIVVKFILGRPTFTLHAYLWLHATFCRDKPRPWRDTAILACPPPPAECIRKGPFLLHSLSIYNNNRIVNLAWGVAYVGGRTGEGREGRTQAAGTDERRAQTGRVRR